MEKGTFVIFSNNPCFLPKARTVPGNVLGIQQVSVGKYMITSLRRCKTHKSLAKAIVFKHVSFFHSASIFSLFSFLKSLCPSMVGSGLWTSSSPPIQTQQISTSTSSPYIAFCRFFLCISALALLAPLPQCLSIYQRSVCPSEPALSWSLSGTNRSALFFLWSSVVPAAP